MKWYRVVGEFRGKIYANDGETVKTQEPTKIDHTVSAKDEEDAKGRALWDIAWLEYALDDYDYVAEPEVTEVPQDQAMRLMGASTLPGLG